MIRRLAISALVLWIGAALAVGSLRLVYGSRPADVNVRWSAAVDAAQRAQLETKYGLTRGALREGTTWGYSLTDLSRANVRALVQDPLVEDTHQIDRTQYTVSSTATRGPYGGAEDSRTPEALEALTVLLLTLGVIPAALAVLERVRAPAGIPTRLRPAAMAFAAPIATLRSTVQRIARQIPPATPQAVALFRIVFGVCVIALVASQPVSSALVTAGPTSNPMTALQRDAMRLFVAAPAVADWLTAWVAAWGGLFVAGALARLSFAMMTAGVVGWAVLFTTGAGAHSVSALMLTLLCLLPSRWGDAWSVDAWRRRRTVRSGTVPHAPDAAYGYTTWMPGVVLGIAFLAAAVAKLRESGLGWILNGTVKYHFLTDSHVAPVDWGASIGMQPWLAVLLSFAAIALEAGVIVGALARTYLYRALAGLGALAILLGFLLFQGLFWPAWWVLLLSFLPWHRMRATPVPAAEPMDSGGRLQAVDGGGHLQAAHLRRLRRVQVAIVIAAAIQQLTASALRIELNPFVSEYEMYATSYSSPDDYERNIGMTYRVVARMNAGGTMTCDISRADAETLSDPAAEAARRDIIARALDDCVEEPARVESVAVEGRRVAIDWSRWRQGDDIIVPLAGPIAVRTEQR